MTAVGYELQIEDGALLHVCLVCGGLRLERPTIAADSFTPDDERPTIALRVVVSDEPQRAHPAPQVEQ